MTKLKSFVRAWGVKLIWMLVVSHFIMACYFVRSDSNTNIVLSGTIVLLPNRAPADGQSAIQVAVDLKNALNISSEGFEVRLESDTLDIHIEQPNKTDQSGVAIGKMTSDRVLTSEIRAYVQLSGGEQRLIANTVVEFYRPPEKIFLTVNPTATVADGNHPISIIAHVTNANDKDVVGRVVTFSSPRIEDIWTTNNIETGIDGYATTTLFSKLAGTRSIEAAVDGYSEATDITFLPGDLDISSCLISMNPNSLDVTSGLFSNIEVWATDQFGNPIEGLLVTVSSDDATDIIMPTDANTNSYGVAIFSFSGTTIGVHTITAVLNGYTLTSSINIVPGNPNATYSILKTDPTSQVADNSNTIIATLTVRSDYNQPLSGRSVTCSASGVSTNISIPAVTDANGVTFCTYATSVAQNENIIVSVGDMTLENPVIFNAGKAISVSINSTKVLKAHSESISLTATAYDAYSNPVPNCEFIWSVTGVSDGLIGHISTSDASGLTKKNIFSSYYGKNKIYVSACGYRVGDNYYPGPSTTIQANAVTNWECSSSIPVDDFQLSLTTNEDVGSIDSTVGDMTGDGIPELITVSESTDKIKVISVANFSGPTILSQNTVNSPKFVEVGDLNNDGFLDAVTVSNNSESVTILLGSGDGSLTIANTYNLAAGSVVAGLALADLDNNGTIDIAISIQSSGYINIFYNNGDGTYTAGSSVFVGNSPSDIAIVDIDHDGNNDIAVLCKSDRRVRIMKGNGSHSFPTEVDISICSVNTPGSMMSTDIDNDGYADFVVSCPGDQSINYVKNITSSNFYVNSFYTYGRSPSILSAMDINGDSKVDFISYNQLGNEIVINYASTWGIVSSISINANESVSSIQIADFNGDGKSDIVAINSSGTASFNRIFKQVPSQIAPAKPGISKMVILPNYNTNGNLRIIAENTNDSSISVFSTKNGKSISRVDYVESIGEKIIIPSYLNADDFIDMTILNTNTKSRSTYFGNSNEIFTINEQNINLWLPAHDSPKGAISMNVNGDGRDDIVYYSTDGNTNVALIANLYGFYDDIDTFYSTGVPSAIAAADFTGNGRSDLAYLTVGGSNLSILYWISDSTFSSTPSSFPTGSTNSIDLLINDFNNDGNMDVVTANVDDNSISLLLGNGDGTFAPATKTFLPETPYRIKSFSRNTYQYPDILVYYKDKNFFSMLINSGNGTFNLIRQTLFSDKLSDVDITYTSDGSIVIISTDPVNQRLIVTPVVCEPSIGG